MQIAIAHFSNINGLKVFLKANFYLEYYIY